MLGLASGTTVPRRLGPIAGRRRTYHDLIRPDTVQRVLPVLHDRSYSAQHTTASSTVLYHWQHYRHSTRSHCTLSSMSPLLRSSLTQNACTNKYEPNIMSSRSTGAPPSFSFQNGAISLQSQQKRAYIFLPSSPTELYHALKSWISDLIDTGPSSTQQQASNNNNTNTAAPGRRMTVSVKLRDRFQQSRNVAVAKFGRHRNRASMTRERYSNQLRTMRDRWRLEGRRRFDIRFDAFRARRKSLRLRMNESLERRRLAMREGFLLTEANRIRGRAKFRYQRAKARVKAKIRARWWRSTEAYTSHVVVLDEPASKSWFDADGYPRTARDAVSGRFVNPWNSESTNGKHDLSDLWKWRVEHRMARAEADLLPPPGDDDDALEHVRKTIYGEASSSSSTTIFNEEEVEDGGRIASFASDGVTLLPPSSDSRIKLTWLGHSSTLVQMRGFTLLTDPIFSQRASAWQLVGPARYTPPALNVDELPSLDVVLISHDHYDHLDYNTILDLVHSDKVRYWAVPLGIKAWLLDHTALQPESIVELEWWQRAYLEREAKDGSVQLKGTSFFGDDIGGSTAPVSGGTGVVLTCAPAQHWCTRTPFDRNRRLWCSWAIRTLDGRAMNDGLNFYFAGDTGLPDTFPLHRQIGDRLGPFDLSAIPIGAYKPSFFMRDSHVNPQEALVIHRAIRSRRSVGVHWGTFALADERYDEPPRLLKKAVQDESLAGSVAADFVTVRLGGSLESRPTVHEVSAGDNGQD